MSCYYYEPSYYREKTDIVYRVSHYDGVTELQKGRSPGARTLLESRCLASYLPPSCLFGFLATRHPLGHAAPFWPLGAVLNARLLFPARRPSGH